MFPEKRDFLRKFLPLIILGTLILIVYLYFFVGVRKIIETLQHTNLLVLFLGVLLMIIDVAFYALTWQSLLQALSVKAKFKDTFLFTWVSVFVDLIIPLESVSGDFTKAYLMLNKVNGENGKVVASVVFQRITFMFTTLASVLAGFLASTVFPYTMPVSVSNITLTITLATSFFLVLLILLSMKRSWTERFVDVGVRFIDYVSHKRFKKKELKPKITEFLDAFYNATGSFRRKPKKLLLPFIFASLAWITNLSVCFTAFASLGYIVPFSIIVIVYSIGITVQYIPIGVPTDVGATEIVMISFFSVFVPPDISAAGTLLTRFITAWLKLFIGLVIFQWMGVKALLRKPSKLKEIQSEKFKLIKPES